MSRRLGVLGSLVLDTIRPAGGGEPTSALGGIAYSLVAFEVAPAEGWATFPLLKVGEDALARARRLIERLGTVASAGGVRAVPEPNNRVELVYGENGGRTERLSGGVPGWSWAELEPLARRCDALYVNLIAGWELDLATARDLGESFRGPVYCDIHSLLLGRRPDGVRYPRVPEGWEEWFRCFDYVQLNERELELLAGDAGLPPWSLADTLARQGPRALFVTLGPRGAAWVAAGGPRLTGPGRAAGGRGAREGEARRGRVPPSRPVEGGDPTGCGDVWGMACYAALLSGAGLWRAATGANRLAARNAGTRGATGLLDAAGAAAPGAEGDGSGEPGRGGP